ncbi:serine protease [Siccirubricoccus deserti]
MKYLPLALLLLIAAPAAAEPQPFRVTNRTGADATALYAVRTPRGAEGLWGNNLLSPTGRCAQARASASTRTKRPAAASTCGWCWPMGANPCCATRTSAWRGIGAGPGGAAPPGPGRRAGAARPAVPQQRPNTGARNVSTGTGFLVAADRVLTNQHVVGGCDRIVMRAPDGRWLGAVPPARVDAQLDLALLAVPGLPGPALAFRSTPEVRRGESVVTYGFPLAGVLSSDPKLTEESSAAWPGWPTTRRNSRSAPRCSRAIPAGRCWTARAMWLASSSPS